MKTHHVNGAHTLAYRTARLDDDGETQVGHRISFEMPWHGGERVQFHLLPTEAWSLGKELLRLAGETGEGPKE